VNKLFLRITQVFVITIALIIILYPLYQTLILSLRPLIDMREYITQVQSRDVRFIPVYILPRAFSFEQYTALDGTFLQAYWVSLLYTVAIIILHFPLAFVLGFVFAKVRFRGRNMLFFIFIASMVLPFHITVVPLNQILHHVNLFGTPWAVILPSVFAPLGVFLLRQFISQVPSEPLEAAVIDGAGMLRILIFIILPIIRPGVAVFFLLTISLQWSAIEPALAFIHDEQWRPVSLWLRSAMTTDPTQIFASGVLYALPMFIVVAVVARNALPNWDDQF